MRLVGPATAPADAHRGRLSSGLRTVDPVLFRRRRRAHRHAALPGGLPAVRARRWGPPLRAARFAVVDVETTGLRPGDDRVLEVAVVTTDARGRIVDEWSALVDPGCDPGPTAVHGITGADLLDAGPFSALAPELARRLDGAVLVGHNLAFDAAFLAAEVDRTTATEGPADGAPPVSVLAGADAGLCTLQVSQALLLRPEGGWSLSSLCEAVGVPLTDPHRALADARATAGLLASLLATTSGRPRPFGRRLTIG
jgi:DNA polymerase-3 subunit epsilon